MFASKNILFTGNAFIYKATISSNVTNYSLTTQLTTAGWDTKKPVLAQITVNSGVEITSSASTTVAFLIGVLPVGSIVTLINNGIIVGLGGAGGRFATLVNGLFGKGANGGTAIQTSAPLVLINNNIISGGGGGGGVGGDIQNSFCQGSDGGQGGTGGSAIIIAANTTVTNNGTLVGGGGGGGGGASYQNGAANESFSSGGGSGGGGRGFSGGGFGYVANDTSNGGCSFGVLGSAKNGGVGTVGTWSAAGTGGSPGTANGTAGSGGGGGSLGASGSNGTNVTGSPIPRNGGAGGIAGRAVTTNSGTLTVNNFGTILGLY
jgi:hypothetical protein